MRARSSGPDIVADGAIPLRFVDDVSYKTMSTCPARGPGRRCSGNGISELIMTVLAAVAQFESPADLRAHQGRQGEPAAWPAARPRAPDQPQARRQHHRPA